MAKGTGLLPIMPARDRADLRRLIKTPGLWGGPLDHGREQTDPDIVRWVKNGWIEARRNGEGSHGFYITDYGRAALAERGGAE